MLVAKIKYLVVVSWMIGLKEKKSMPYSLLRLITFFVD